MGDVVELGCETSLDIEPDKVLTAALGKMDRVLVIGEHKDGDSYYASSTGDIPWIVWQCELAKREAMKDGE